MKCILEDSYGKEQFNTIKEALENAIVMWEYNTSYPNCIKKLDGTIVKTEEDIYNYYDRWWREVYIKKERRGGIKE